MSAFISKARSAVCRVTPRAVVNGIGRLRGGKKKQNPRQRFVEHLRQSDVFLVGHPKSGNTWLGYLLAVLTQRDTEKKINISNVGEYAPTIHSSDQQIARYGELMEPRVFRTENPLFPELYPKTIYIIRDPRAALLSYYHHCVHDTAEANWSIEDFVEEIMRDGCIKRLEPTLVRWDRQIEAWTRRAEQQAVKFVRYEDLKSDCAGELEELSEFIGLQVGEAEIADAVERGDFKNMRAEEKTYGAESYPGEKGARGFFVRKGKVDSWKEEMPPAVSARIEEVFGPVMRRLGYLD